MAKAKPEISVKTPQPASLSTLLPKTQEAHPHQNFDRASRGALFSTTGGVSFHAFFEAWSDWAQHFARAPGRQLELAERGQKNMVKLIQQTLNPGAETAPAFTPKHYDHRFNHPGWKKAPFNALSQIFLAEQDWWDYATDPLRGLPTQDADRTRFMVRQILDMMSPSNFPTLNPEIIEQTRACQGRNLAEGASNFVKDFNRAVSQTPAPVPEGYQIGTDLACTTGEVVFRNDLFELIQYTPLTDKVQAEPILIVPAWIMKYYVLDLSPHNSMVRFLGEQGFTVFMISWCNPTSDQAELSLEDYRKKGVMTALDTVNAIVPDQKVHALGYCLGGTILAIAAATMARDKDTRLASITLMAAQVDFLEAGELLLFLDESQVSALEDMMWENGYLDGPQMGRAFTVIRAEDLIYSRAVRRYFLGQDDVPTDMGVWVSDTTRMPARMHSEYLRGLFLENRLTSGRFAVEGRLIALKDISAPIFAVGTETDHIAPWRSVYKTQLFTDNDLTFVLTSGGHNSGIINEPDAKRGHFRMGQRQADALYVGPDLWLAQNAPKPGSWWPDLADWLKAKSSGVVAPPEIGAPQKGLPLLGAAPGTYVHQM